MSNLNNLISKIIEDANINAAQILKDAEVEKNNIIEKMTIEATAKTEDIIHKSNLEAKSKKDRMLSNANLQLRNDKLKAKQTVIDIVFDKTLDTLVNLPDNEYLDLIKSLILANSATGDEIIIINEKDKQRITESFINDVNYSLSEINKSGKISLSNEVRTIQGGFVLASNGVEINNSFEALVYSLRESIEYKIAEVLFN